MIHDDDNDNDDNNSNIYNDNNNNDNDNNNHNDNNHELDDNDNDNDNNDPTITQPSPLSESLEFRTTTNTTTTTTTPRFSRRSTKRILDDNDEDSETLYSQDSLTAPAKQVTIISEVGDELTINIMKSADNVSMPVVSSYDNYDDDNYDDDDNDYGDITSIRQQLLRRKITVDDKVDDKLQIDPALWSSVASDNDLDEYASRLLKQCDKLLQSYDGHSDGHSSSALRDLDRSVVVSRTQHSNEAVDDTLLTREEAKRTIQQSVESEASVFLYLEANASDANADTVIQVDDGLDETAVDSTNTASDKHSQRLSQSAFLSDDSTASDGPSSAYEPLALEGHHEYVQEDCLDVERSFDEDDIVPYMTDPYVKLLFEKLSDTRTEIKRLESGMFACH